MIPTPVFPIWRRTWEGVPDVGSLAARADVFVTRRNCGPQEVPAFTSALDVEALLRLEQLAKRDAFDEELPRTLRLALCRLSIERLNPFVRAARWVRWLDLERAFTVASESSDLLTSALVLRSLVEELDTLLRLREYERRAVEVWERNRKSRLPDLADCRLMRDFAEFLTNRILPATHTLGREEMAAPRPIVELPYAGEDELAGTFHALSDYAHPNYGSHFLFLFPERSRAGVVLLKAVVTVYERFFTLDWAEEAAGVPTSNAARSPRPASDDWRHFVGVELPRLRARAADWQYDPESWPVPLDRFAERSGEEEVRDRGLTAHLAAGAGPSGRALAPLLAALTDRAADESVGPEAIWSHLGLGLPPTVAGVLGLGSSRRTAGCLEELARGLPSGGRFPTAPPYDAWVEFVVGCASLWAGTMLGKIESLRLSAARMFNARSALGAVICTRALLEHWAVAAHLDSQFSNLWARVEEEATSGRDPGPALSQLEKKIGVYLTGTQGTNEADTDWRGRLAGQEAPKAWHVNLFAAVDKSLPPREEVLGFMYALFSRVIHGGRFTGGDLLPAVADGNADRLLLKALMVLAQFEDTSWVIGACYALLPTATRLQRPGVALAAGVSELRDALRHGRLPKVLVENRDYFGTGTEDDPYRFRRALDYHEAFAHFCQAHALSLDDRRLCGVRGSLVIDVVETPGGRTVYFARDLGPEFHSGEM